MFNGNHSLYMAIFNSYVSLPEGSRFFFKWADLAFPWTCHRCTDLWEVEMILDFWAFERPWHWDTWNWWNHIIKGYDITLGDPLRLTTSYNPVQICSQMKTGQPKLISSWPSLLLFCQHSLPFLVDLRMISPRLKPPSHLSIGDMYIIVYYLVGGFNLSLWKMMEFVSWYDYSQYFWEKTCSKPPTSV